MQYKNGLAIGASSALDMLDRIKAFEEVMDLPDTPDEYQMNVHNERKTCKVCDEHIDSANTSERGLLAELCDHCYNIEEDVFEEI
jgi:hypothetical protein